MAQDELRAYLEAERQKVDAGDYTHAAVSSRRTLQDATDEYLRHRRHEKACSPRTMTDYRKTIDRYLLRDTARPWALAEPDTPLAVIDRRAVEAFRERLLAPERKLSHRTVQKVLVILHGIMERAVRKEWLAVNPCANVERVHVKRNGRIAVLSYEEIEHVARHARDAMTGDLIRVAAYTGLRLGELRALRWRDVDWAAGNVHVAWNLPNGSQVKDEKAPKSGKARHVPLVNDAAAALERLSRRHDYSQPDDRVFARPTGGPLSGDDMRAGLYAAMDAANVSRDRGTGQSFHFHDLRHTFGSMMARAGFPIRDLQAFMGHANITTTEVYTHYLPRTDVAARFQAWRDEQAAAVPAVATR